MEILLSTYAPWEEEVEDTFNLSCYVDLDQASSVYHPLKSGITTEIIES